MMCSALMANDLFRQVLFDGKGCVPSIPVIQAHIEQAWAKGFDCEGARQLGYSVVGSTKWIGKVTFGKLFQREFSIKQTNKQRRKPLNTFSLTNTTHTRINGVCSFVAFVWY